METFTRHNKSTAISWCETFLLLGVSAAPNPHKRTADSLGNHVTETPPDKL